jgi:CRISPR system Cascade subunit CasE
MYLSKLLINVISRDFRRDHADIRQMHRTIMSGFDDITDGTPARQSLAVLWRLDDVHRGFALYVQSLAKPEWARLPADYLAETARVRTLQPVLDSIAPGRRFAFRLVASPTRTIPRPADRERVAEGRRTQGIKVPHHKPENQIDWLVRQGERMGFVIPSGRNGQPDVAPTPCLKLIGQQRSGERGPITITPVRFDGHLVITDNTAFAEAIRTGIGRGKAYGCGLVSLAPARNG